MLDDLNAIADQPYKPLTPEIHARLIKQARGKGKRAKHALDQLLRAHIRLIMKVVGRYTQKQTESYDREDMIMDAFIAFRQAVTSYDDGRARFSTYAVAAMRREIERGLDNNGKAIRIPVGISAQRRKLAAISHELTQKLGRVPTLAELSQASGIDKATVEKIHNLPYVALSIDDPDHRQNPLSERLRVEADHETTEQSQSRSAALAIIASHLKPRAFDFLCAYHGFDQPEASMEELARKHSLTRQRVQAILASAHRTLRQPSIAPILRELLTPDQSL